VRFSKKYAKGSNEPLATDVGNTDAVEDDVNMGWGCEWKHVLLEQADSVVRRCPTTKQMPQALPLSRFQI
jgi:hypothetical protein